MWWAFLTVGDVGLPLDFSYLLPLVQDSQRHNSLERGTTLVREKKTEASLPTHNNSAIYALLDKDESSTNMLVYITATTTLVNNVGTDDQGGLLLAWPRSRVLANHSEVCPPSSLWS